MPLGALLLVVWIALWLALGVLIVWELTDNLPLPRRTGVRLGGLLLVVGFVWYIWAQTINALFYWAVLRTLGVLLIFS